MEINKLPVETQALLGCNTEVVVDYTDLSDTAGTTKTLTVAVDAGKLVTGGPHILSTTFTDGAATMSSLVYTVGDGDDADHYLTSTEVEETGTEITYKAGTGTTKAYTVASDTVDLAFTATGANLSTLTAGKLKVYLNIADLEDLK